MSIILDTNFIFSLTTTSDPNHKLAKEQFAKLDEEDAIIPFVVVSELIVASETVDFLKFCDDVGGMFIPNADGDLKFIQTHLDLQTRRQLKANDCLILALAYRFKLDILTFDKNLIRAHKKLGIKRP